MNRISVHVTEIPVNVGERWISPHPYLSMFPTVDSAVLSVLAGATKPRTGREIARLAGRSQSATQSVLDRLVEHGLVLQEAVGRSRIYTLNGEHLAAEPISSLVNLRDLLVARLRENLDLWRPSPLHASIFGSTARGDGDVESDIDLFLVRRRQVAEDDEAWRGAVDDLGAKVFEWTGNHAGIAEVGERELAGLRRDQPAIVSSIKAEALDLFGKSVREVLGRA